MDALFEYGIMTEQSDIRAHVSVVAQTIYVFPTKYGVSAIETHQPVLRSAGQPGVKGPTADGWLVKPDWITDLRRLRFPSWPHWEAFTQDLSTSRKGAMAVDCVLAAMKVGRFPFWVDAVEDGRPYVQIAGTDVLVFCKKRVQVKCDYRGGDPPGTGHLFLQRAERNPLKRT